MSDLIDREALLRQIDIDSEGEPGYYGDTWKFIDTIKSMPSATDTNICTKLGANLAEVGTDCISRQAAIDALNNMYQAAEKWWKRAKSDVAKARAETCMSTVSEIKMRIWKLPSAQPKQRTGKWIPQDHNKRAGNISTCVYCYPICSKCGKVGIETYKYCPMCGAKMEGADDE